MTIAKYTMQVSKCLFMNPTSFCQIPKFSDDLGQVIHRPKCVGMVLAQYAFARIHGLVL
jgi:hypothetical protein